MVITSQILHNIIVEDDYPVKNVTVGGAIFYIQFSPDNFNTLIHSIIEFLSKNVTGRALDGSKYSGDKFIRALPVPVARILVHECITFQDEIGLDILNSIEEWSDTPVSQNLWTVIKATSIPFVLTLPEDNKLSVFQRAWIMYSSIEDKIERNKLIESVIDSLRPWLNPEMWTKMKDREKNQRENFQFDDADIDRRLQEKADRLAKERKQQDEDYDIIELEEKGDG